MELARDAGIASMGGGFHGFFLSHNLRSDEAVGYLNAALEGKDTQLFLLALRDVAEAHCGLKLLSQKARLNRENLYRMLSLKGTPEIASLEAVLEALGLKFVELFRVIVKKYSRYFIVTYIKVNPMTFSLINIYT